MLEDSERLAPISQTLEAQRRFFKALYLDERRLLYRSLPLDYLRGRAKISGWKRLRGFDKPPDFFRDRIAMEGVTSAGFRCLLGQRSVYPTKRADVELFLSELKSDWETDFPLELPQRHRMLTEYCQRGLLAPFHSMLDRSLDRLLASKLADQATILACWVSQLGVFEQMTRRAVVLDLNVKSLRGELGGNDESRKFRSYVDGFQDSFERARFFAAYPVLYRAMVAKLNSWSAALEEFFERLALDRALLESQLGVPRQCALQSIQSSGDTHNNGRSVLVLHFSDDSRIVYKPRDTSIEAAFQKYLTFFNSADPDIDLKTIRVLDRGEYGWVEHVNFSGQTSEVGSRRYHTKLGFLTAVVHSLSGVDVFFENLVACGTEPVIIDLETMFHAPIEDLVGGPVNQRQMIIHRSLTGIGILPQPNVGASDTEIFDISVMGAKTEARAPYKVTGIENFGRSDMRITSIPGWIPENHASSEGRFDVDTASECFMSGLSRGYECILRNRDVLAKNDGVIDQIFGQCSRRLIVRDTKVYGTLQQDENHPDLLRDQIDRQWFWDSLWSDLPARPVLRHFIESELNQMKLQDIPYFYGGVDSTYVMGGDGERIDLTDIVKISPLQFVKTNLLQQTSSDVEEQVRLAATALGLSKLPNVTQPQLSAEASPIANADQVACFIRKRLVRKGALPWLDTSICPVPKATGLDPVRAVPCDPFLYEGVMGVSMYLHDLALATGNRNHMADSVSLVESIFTELQLNSSSSPSGFVGTGSIVYAVDRCIRSADAFKCFDGRLNRLVEEIAQSVEGETRLDFLVGIAGVAAALIPFAERTSNYRARKTLEAIGERLHAAAANCLTHDSPIDGMDCMRGLSHGLSGVALALFRLSVFLRRNEFQAMAKRLLLHELDLVKTHGWTDGHFFDGAPLVGWCHGSAGIMLALDSMSELRQESNELSNYFRMSVAYTLEHGNYDSSCLCHGSVGNLFCLESSVPSNDRLESFEGTCNSKLLNSGFSSFGAAQTMGVGLMTGLAGAGYFFLSRSDTRFNRGFLTLA